MNLLRLLLRDYISERGFIATPHAIEDFLGWAEEDLARHPIDSASVDIGKVVLSRGEPREDAELPLGREVGTQELRPVMLGGRPQLTTAYLGSHSPDGRPVVAGFGGSGRP